MVWFGLGLNLGLPDHCRNGTVIGTNTLDKSGTASYSNEWVLQTPQISDLVSYPVQSFFGRRGGLAGYSKILSMKLFKKWIFVSHTLYFCEFITNNSWPWTNREVGEPLVPEKNPKNNKKHSSLCLMVFSLKNSRDSIQPIVGDGDKGVQYLFPRVLVQMWT